MPWNIGGIRFGLLGRCDQNPATVLLFFSVISWVSPTFWRMRYGEMNIPTDSFFLFYAFRYKISYIVLNATILRKNGWMKILKIKILATIEV